MREREKEGERERERVWGFAIIAQCFLFVRTERYIFVTDDVLSTRDLRKKAQL